MYYDKLTLPNGVRVLTEHIPGIRSAAVGIWIGSGSRSETAAESGSAHFVEHMSFKGTERRTAAQLAQEMDALGGQINASTTKEQTVYYAWVLDTHLRQTVDMLSDMLFHSRFDPADVETERAVILEEIGMYADNPEDLCNERLSKVIYRGSPLSRPILGRKASLEHITAERLRDWQKRHYIPSRIVISLAGSFQDSDVEDLCQRFSGFSGAPLNRQKAASYLPAFTVKRKLIEQNHFALAFPGIPVSDSRRFTLQVLSSILGGGMSSRLWQEIREKRGLCYSVYTYGMGYADLGTFCIYTATNQNTEEKALRAIIQEIRRFVEEGVTLEELNRAREHSKANVLMGLESTQSHMSALGRGELVFEKVFSIEEVIAAYDAVSSEDVQNLARELLDFQRVSLSAVGRVRREEEYREILFS